MMSKKHVVDQRAVGVSGGTPALDARVFLFLFKYNYIFKPENATNGRMPCVP